MRRLGVCHEYRPRRRPRRLHGGVRAVLSKFTVTAFTHSLPNRYILLNLPYMILHTILTPSTSAPEAKSLRRVLGSGFFGALVPLVYFYLQHKQHRVAGGASPSDHDLASSSTALRRLIANVIRTNSLLNLRARRVVADRSRRHVRLDRDPRLPRLADRSPSPAVHLADRQDPLRARREPGLLCADDGGAARTGHARESVGESRDRDGGDSALCRRHLPRCALGQVPLPTSPCGTDQRD